MSSLFERTEQLSNAFRVEMNTEIPSYISNFDCLTPSILTINTMTVSCKTSLKQFNSFLPYLKEYLTENPIEDGIIISTSTMGKNAIILKISQKWGEDLEFQKNISAKLFGNGAVHITGVTLPTEAVLISDYLCKYMSTLPFLREEKGEEGEGEEEITIKTTEINVCMIQSTFDLGEHISLPEAYQRWIKERTNSIANKKERVIFNPEKHHALHIKFTSVCPSLSSIIFSSGKVIITGARKPGDLSHAFNEICTFFDNITRPSSIVYPRVIIEKIPKKRGRKRKIDTVDDYNGITL